MNKKLVITAISSLLLYGTANAQEAATADSVADVKFIVDNLWILISAALVFIMHLGFSALESGLCQKKNVVNVLLDGYKLGNRIQIIDNWSKIVLSEQLSTNGLNVGHLPSGIYYVSIYDNLELLKLQRLMIY